MNVCFFLGFPSVEIKSDDEYLLIFLHHVISFIQREPAEIIRSVIYVYIIDQARGQDGWILAEFSFCVFMDRDEVEVHKNAKRERGQYPAILTELAWSIKDLLYGIKSTEKIIFVLVYFRALKRKPVI